MAETCGASGPHDLSTEFLVGNLSRHKTLDQLKSSEFFARHGADVERLLASAQVVSCPEASPRLRAFLRVAQWNVEKGVSFAGILETLRQDPILKWADLILLNEADWGMKRSGNRHVALALAEELGMHMAFGPAHLELTPGTGSDLMLAGVNRESLQGNAVLSRYPIVDAAVLPLPVCYEPYHFDEKRYGRRICLWTRVDVRGATLRVGAVHLEVRDTPRCRTLQVRHLLGSIPAPGREPVLLAGDLNSNGFSRGTLVRTLRSVTRLIARPPARVMHELCHPEQGSEPMFQALRAAGFRWDELNDAAATASASLGDLEDALMLPAVLRRLILQRLEPYGGELRMKLDWIVGRAVQALRNGEVRDSNTDVRSLDPGAVACQWSGPNRVSDHLPVFADVRLPQAPDPSSALHPEVGAGSAK